MRHAITPASGPVSRALAPFLLTLLALVGTLALAGCQRQSDGGEVEVTGILTEESADCQALRSEDGELYALTGELGTVRSGDTVQVRGSLAAEGLCDRGIPVRVASLKVVDGPSTGESVGEVDRGGETATGGDRPDREAEEDPIGEAGEAGQVLLEGELTDEGVECQAFRSDEGDLYTLVGNVKEFVAGDRVRIVATPVRMSTCMQGTTVEIIEIGLVEETDESPP